MSRRASPMDESPSSFLCPITGELMEDPVMTVLSQTYERAAIERWFNEVVHRHGQLRDPITNLRLPSKELRPNYALKSAITEYRERKAKSLAAKERKKGEVYKWLETLGLVQYSKLFLEEGFDSLEAMALLRQEDLSAMGVKRGHARILLNNLPRSARPPPITAKQVKRRMRVSTRIPSKSPRTLVPPSLEVKRNSIATTPKADARTMKELGEAEYKQGLEFERNGEDKASCWGKAYPFYVKAMKLGHGAATLKVGLCHLFGMHATRIDYKKGAAFVTEAAQRGVKEAELWLGYCYGFGKGLTRNQSIAVQLLVPDSKIMEDATLETMSIPEIPRDKGEAADGSFVIPDDDKENIHSNNNIEEKSKENVHSNRIEEKSKGKAEQDIASLSDGISRIKTSSPTSLHRKKTQTQSTVDTLSTVDALKSPETKYDKNFDSAGLGLFFAAICYHRGGYGLEKDTEKAKILYFKAFDRLVNAAASGDPFAQNSLGICYQYGTGVTQNFSKAVEYYSAAGVFGHADAQYSLGVAYHDGKGLQKNEERAVVMYSAAARQGHPTAQAILGWCFVQRIARNSPRTGRALRGRREECKKAVEMWTLSAEAGNCALAQYSLGLCFETGRAGVTMDQEQAIYWYKKAADQEFQRAQVKLKELEQLILSPPSESLPTTPQQLS